MNRLILSCLLCLLIGTSFFGVTSHDFLGMDDHIYVWNNDMVKQGLTWQGVKWAFCADLCYASEQADYWQPMTFLSRMLDVQIFGMKSGWHHAVNILLHMFNSVVLLLILIQLTGRRMLSFFAVALFAVHPMNVEILGWVTARKDVLSHAFGLVSLWLYCRDGSSTRLIQFSMFVLFACSLMSKPMMITLPAIFILVDYYQNQDRTFFKLVFESLRRNWFMWLLSLAYLPIPWMGQPDAFKDTYNSAIVKAINVIPFYLGKILWPVNLTLYGPVPYQPIAVWQTIMSVIFICVTTFIFWKYRGRVREVFFGWLFFGVLALPVLALNWPADRFVYLPKVGIFLVILFGVNYLGRTIKGLNKVTIGALGSIVLIFAVLSFKLIPYWQNDEILMTRVLRFYPNNYAAHNILGTWYGQKGQLKKSENHLLKAIEIFPDREKPWTNLANIRMAQGRFEDAQQMLQKADKLKPHDYQIQVNLGNASLNLRQITQAIEYYQKALRLRGEDSSILNNLSIAYFQLGKYQESLRIADQVQSNSLYCFLAKSVYPLQISSDIKSLFLQKCPMK